MDIKNLTEGDRVELYTILIHQGSFNKGHIPKDWSDGFLRPIPKPGKDHHKLNGYHILTMQHHWEAHGMHCCQQTHLTRDLEEREILPANQGVGVRWGDVRPGKCTWKNAAAFAYDMYKGFQRKEQKVAVAIDLTDAYNGVQFKLLMDLFI